MKSGCLTVPLKPMEKKKHFWSLGHKSNELSCETKDGKLRSTTFENITSSAKPFKTLPTPEPLVKVIECLVLLVPPEVITS